MTTLSNLITPTDVATAENELTLKNKTIKGSENTISDISLDSAVTGVLPVSKGGTGATSLVGLLKGTGAAIEAVVSGVDIKTINGNNILGAGDITFGGGGTVTSVSGTGTASGLTLSGNVTTSGSLTLSGEVNSLAAGTYGINISGNAATASNASAVNGYSIPAPSTTGNVLTSNGSTWVSSPAPSGGGTVTSVSGTGTASGLTLSGNVTTSGSLTLSGTVNSLASGTYPISITGNAATVNGYNIPSPGESGNVLTSNGSIWVSTKPTYKPEINTPTNVSPPNGSTNISTTVALTATAFSSAFSVTMAASQWQISTASDFSAIVLDTGDVAGTSTSYSIPSSTIGNNTQYYWRVRYKDNNGKYSDWSSPTNFTTEASAGPGKIGDPFGGGFYAGDIVVSGKRYYLVVSPKSAQPSSFYEWDASDTPSDVTQANTLNDGFSATAALAQIPTAYCAIVAKGVEAGGYTDWYLPSRDELELCYRNFKPDNGENSTEIRPKAAISYPQGDDVAGDTAGRNRNSSPAGSGYQLSSPGMTNVFDFQSKKAEAFVADGANYASSSQCPTQSFGISCWSQGFVTGYQSDLGKAEGYRVRAVRRVPA